MMTNSFAEVALVIGGSTELSIVVKATVLLALGLGTGRLARRTRASVRHVLLASTFGVLLALPVAAFFEPPVSANPAGVKPIRGIEPGASCMPLKPGSSTPQQSSADTASIPTPHRL